MAYTSIVELIDNCTDVEELIDRIIAADANERGINCVDSFKQMKTLWEAMLASVNNYDGSLKSNSGLSGGDAKKYEDFRNAGGGVVGDLLANLIKNALKVSESNACMKRIVAAPTAGSCGVIPAVLITLYNHRKANLASFQPTLIKNENVSKDDNNFTLDDKIVRSLYLSAAVGEVIAFRASIAGAEGGCQAEIGAASSMAACAFAYLNGGNIEQIMHAGALALKALLGLACDPVGGYVEVPCIKRNVTGAANAVTSAELALAGIESRIPFDEVIDAMGEIGRKMDISLRETSTGGLAMTPTGRQYLPKQD